MIVLTFSGTIRELSYSHLGGKWTTHGPSLILNALRGKN